MAQVKIYGLKSHLDEHKSSISAAIHDAVMSELEYPPEKKFHRFIQLEPSDFIYPDDRSERYTIIEISMFEGRSVGAKKALLRKLFFNLSAQSGISSQDIEITLFETPKENWGIRGMPADELVLGYKVDV